MHELYELFGCVFSFIVMLLKKKNIQKQKSNGYLTSIFVNEQFAYNQRKTKNIEQFLAVPKKRNNIKAQTQPHY